MQTPIKLGGFVAALAAVLGISFGVGNAVGPLGHTATNTHLMEGEDMTNSTTESSSGQTESGYVSRDAGGNPPGGLMISQNGYTFEPSETILEQGRTTVTFRILGPDGQPVTDFEPTHDADLHFFAVARDLNSFDHLHPRMDDSGTWSTDVDLTPGAWRLLADFRPVGQETMTLGSDVFVAGDYQAQPLPPVSATATVDDYMVTVRGGLTAGESSELTLTVARGGEPVTDLEPYLAAYGHLVALRAGDMAYLHVHPEGSPGDGTTAPGPEISFHATAPSSGAYRLFLDFKHGGVVRTAAFTVHATPSNGSDSPAATDQAEFGAHGDHVHN